jgi:diaminopimelate decarboxylase
VGKCCESGDVLIPEIELPEIRPGDVLVVEGTGAYNHSMASNYNLIPRPGVVFLKEGKMELVVRPESFFDLVRRDLVPESSGEEGQ